MRRFILAAFGTTVLTACQPATTELTEEQKAEVIQAIADNWAGFEEALVNEDYDGWAAFWTQDARVMQPGTNVRGDDLFDVGREMFTSGTDYSAFEVEPLETFIHGDVAYQIGQYDIAYQLPDNEPAEVHMYYFTRWVQQGGVWKVDRILAGPRNAAPDG